MNRSAWIIRTRRKVSLSAVVLFPLKSVSICVHRWSPSASFKLRFCFQDEIKRGLGGSPELAEPGLFNDLAQSVLPSLRSERQANLLAARSGQADHCRES